MRTGHIVMGIALMLSVMMVNRLPAGEAALVQLDGTGSSDPDGDRLRYRWRQVRGPRTKLSNPRSAKPYFRTNEPGKYLFELVVSDGRRESKPALVEVIVERENLRPEARVPAEVQTEVDRRVIIDGSKSRDADGSALLYRWRQLSGPPLYLSKDKLSSRKLIVQPKKAGVYELELVVFDGKVWSHGAVCRMTVKPANLEPIARAIAVNKTVLKRSVAELKPDLSEKVPTAFATAKPYAQTGEMVKIDGTKSVSPLDKPLRYYWKQKSGPFVRSFDRKTDAIISFIPRGEGEYVFELVVSDGTHDSLPATVTVTVKRTNEIPVAVIDSPGTGFVGTPVKLDGSRSFDKEGATLKYNWRQTDGPRVLGYMVDRELGIRVSSFIPRKPGVYKFELVVSDGQRLSLPANAVVRIKARNLPPEVTVSGELIIKSGETAVLQGKGVDSDGDNLTCEWRQVSGPPLLSSPARQQAITLTPAEDGVYVFQFSVSDGVNQPVVKSTTIKVIGDRSLTPVPVPKLEPVELSRTSTPPAPKPRRFFQRLAEPFKKRAWKQEELDDISTSTPAWYKNK